MRWTTPLFDTFDLLCLGAPNLREHASRRPHENTWSSGRRSCKNGWRDRRHDAA